MSDSNVPREKAVATDFRGFTRIKAKIFRMEDN
jgi:hypothetical protein